VLGLPKLTLNLLAISHCIGNADTISNAAYKSNNGEDWLLNPGTSSQKKKFPTING
jgi:hypothetical protein